MSLAEGQLLSAEEPLTDSSHPVCWLLDLGRPGVTRPPGLLPFTKCIWRACVEMPSCQLGALSESEPQVGPLNRRVRL